MAKTKVLLMKVKDVPHPTQQFKQVEVDELQDYYNHLGCDLFDIVSRKIGDRFYDVYCDDCGLFEDDPIISMVNKNGEPMLVGNLIFANHNAAGETTSLSDEDVRYIVKNTCFAIDSKGRGLFRVIGNYE